MKKSLLFFFSLFIVVRFAYGGESLYLMPRDADSAVKVLARDLENAKKSIHISIYSFTHKTLAKSLKKAAGHGVTVTILFDAEQNGPKSYTRLGDLAKIKNIDVYTIKGLKDEKKGYFGKMHMKTAIIDGKKAYFGSANWSYSAFSKNYELLYATDSPEIIKECDRFFEQMVEKSTPYYR